MYIYFHGGESTIYVGYNAKFGKIDTQHISSCAISSTKKIYFYIKGSDSELTVAVHNEGEDKYNRCTAFEIKGEDMKLFYVNFFARSYQIAPFMADVNSLIFSTDIENIGISLFESRFEDNAQKLFRQISYFNLNEEVNRSREKQLLQEGYNIKSLFESQNEVLNILDYSNILVDKNLEEGDDMLEFLSQQKSSTDSYARSMLDAMNNWMADTSKQFELMEKDALDLLTEYENFDLDVEFEKTKGVMSKVTQKVGANWESFNNFRLNSETIKSNLDYLKRKKKYVDKFPETIRYLKEDVWAKWYSDGYGSTILLMFLGLGLVIIVALLAILKRLNSMQKTQSFS